MINTRFKALLAVALMSVSSLSFAGFTLDGIVTGTDTYSEQYDLDFQFDNGAQSGGTGFMWLGTDGTDIFVMLEVPTGIHDLTFGTGTAPGWEGTKDYNKDGNPGMAKNKVTGSEKWKFNLDGQGTAEIKMKDNGALGYELKQDAGGAIKGASTSFDYNKGLDANNNAVDWSVNSPGGCYNDAAITTDAECYAKIATIPGAENYQVAQRYEIQIDGSLFALGSLVEIVDYISGVEIHASPMKGMQSNVTFDPPCFGNQAMCNPTTDPNPNAIPEPSSIALLALSLGLIRLQRKQKT